MGLYWHICCQILAHQILKTPAIFGRCLHKQRIFEISTCGTHLLLPSWLNPFPRDFILAFQLPVCLCLSHLVFCLVHEKMGFSHFTSPPLLISGCCSQTSCPCVRRIAMLFPCCPCHLSLRATLLPARRSLLFLCICGAEGP